MRFKELLAEDNAEIFQLEEMGELVLLDGVILKVHITTSTSKISSAENRNFNGLHGDFLTVYFKSADYTGKRKRIPRQGEFCYIKGKRYEVLSSNEDLGVAKIVLQSYRQNTLRGAILPDD